MTARPIAGSRRDVSGVPELVTQVHGRQVSAAARASESWRLRSAEDNLYSLWLALKVSERLDRRVRLPEADGSCLLTSDRWDFLTAGAKRRCADVV